MKNLTWTESNNIEFKKLEDLIGNIRAKYLSMEAEKQKSCIKLLLNRQI